MKRCIDTFIGRCKSVPAFTANITMELFNQMTLGRAGECARVLFNTRSRGAAPCAAAAMEEEARAQVRCALRCRLSLVVDVAQPQLVARLQRHQRLQPQRPGLCSSAHVGLARVVRSCYRRVQRSSGRHVALVLNLEPAPNSAGVSTRASDDEIP